MNQTEQTKIRFWGGLRTIGGTIISIECGKHRVIFDFGFIFRAGHQLIDEHLKKRSTRIVYDALQLDLIPPIDGIYERADLVGTTLRSVDEDDRETVVLVSHMHLDHMGGIGMLSPKIPVYVTASSLQLYESLATIGEKVEGYTPTFKVCTEDVSFAVGSITITPIAVDHDIIGAVGFRIDTPDGSLFYTGDYRLHGFHPKKIEQAIHVAQQTDVLIMEGTTLSDVETMRSPLRADCQIPEDYPLEHSLPERITALTKEYQGMIFLNLYHRNIERLVHLLQSAEKIGREIVLQLPTAYLVHQITKETNFLLYCSSELAQRMHDDQLTEWEQQLLSQYRTVHTTHLNEQPSRYLIQMTYEQSFELFDLQVAGGLYLHANGVPLGAFDPAYQNLKKLLKRLQLDFHVVGSGGHALPQHLKYVLEQINPKTFIPLHSFHPERIVPDQAQLLLPEYGVTYRLCNGLLKK